MEIQLDLLKSNNRKNDDDNKDNNKNIGTYCWQQQQPYIDNSNDNFNAAKNILQIDCNSKLQVKKAACSLTTLPKQLAKRISMKLSFKRQ